MMEWSIHPSAQQEHDEWIEYFGGIDEELAIAFELRYLENRHHICSNPELHRVRHGKTRRVNLHPRFGEYYIAYMIWREKIVILAVAHAKRRPYYWSKRISESKKLF